jgi:hypothetical protein
MEAQIDESVCLVCESVNFIQIWMLFQNVNQIYSFLCGNNEIILAI